MHRLPRNSDKTGTGTLQNAFAHAAKNCAAVLFPRLCIICKNALSQNSAWLCGRCDSLLSLNQSSRDPCPLCSQNRRIQSCDCASSWNRPFEMIFSLFDFDETLKAIVHEFKYNGMKKLAYDVAMAYAHCIPSSFLCDMDIVVPVPLHFFRSIRRGYNQAEHVARGIIRGSGCAATLCNGGLRRKKMTKTQTALSREERVKNVQNAFSVSGRKKPLFKDKSVVLVDDIVTTASTTGQCARALLDAGAKKVRVLSLARD